jgi:general secretion pathway protein G
MLAGKNVSRPAHIGGKLVHLIDPADDFANNGGVAQITDNKLIRRWFRKIVPLDIHSADPETFGLQSLYQVATNETARSGYKYFARWHSLHLSLSHMAAYLASTQQYHSVILELSGSRASRADGKYRMRARKRVSTGESGLTLLELIIASTILLVLTAAALPVVRFTIIRAKEAELHRELREMRDAIDHYKDAADSNLVRVQLGSEGYPPDLDTLVKGVEYGGSAGKKKRFLRRIPVDPMTGRAEWSLRSFQDDPDSTSWGGGNVFDVHSKSTGTALDGTKYADW